jgi:hypothetical protein
LLFSSSSSSLPLSRASGAFLAIIYELDPGLAGDVFVRNSKASEANGTRLGVSRPSVELQ